MNSVKLSGALIDTLKSYWRQRAALELYRGQFKNVVVTQRMNYAGIPQVGYATGFLNDEAVSDALGAIDTYFQSKLSSDDFTVLISHFEAFLSFSIVAIGGNASGTLGNLQRQFEALYSVPQTLIDDVDEIRERRNMLVHHNGEVKPRYSVAANKVYARAATYVSDPSIITHVDVKPAYLSYCVDVFCKYANSAIRNP